MIVTLDCQPGCTRPDDLLPYAIEGTLYKPAHFTVLSKGFGSWAWKLDEDQVEGSIEVRSIIFANIEKLFHAGRIRYGGVE